MVADTSSPGGDVVRLKFVDGLIDAAGVDEIVLVCRKRTTLQLK
jgi:hypothetical protein